MKNYTLYATIVDSDTTQIAKIESSLSISELRTGDTLKEFIEMLALEYEAWADVLNSTRAAVIFDSETLEKIRINRGPYRLSVNNL